MNRFSSSSTSISHIYWPRMFSRIAPVQPMRPAQRARGARAGVGGGGWGVGSLLKWAWWHLASMMTRRQNFWKVPLMVWMEMSLIALSIYDHATAKTKTEKSHYGTSYGKGTGGYCLWRIFFILGVRGPGYAAAAYAARDWGGGGAVSGWRARAGVCLCMFEREREREGVCVCFCIHILCVFYMLCVCMSIYMYILIARHLCYLFGVFVYVLNYWCICLFIHSFIVNSLPSTTTASSGSRLNLFFY
jgi:hypothetical protein